MSTTTEQIAEVVDAWADLGPTRRLPSSERRPLPSAKTLEIIGRLGLRYPPANTVDRESHAARVVLLAEDCADIDPKLLDAAASEWSRRNPFFPRACELREQAFAIGRISRSDRILEAPRPAATPKPEAPPLTEAEIRKLPRHLISLGVKLGEIDQDLAEQIRNEAA